MVCYTIYSNGGYVRGKSKQADAVSNDYFGKQLHNTQDPPCRTLGSQDRSEPTFDDVQKLRHKAASPKQVIGASLSEPHTSVTAFVEVVCMSVCPQPYTVNFK